MTCRGSGESRETWCDVIQASGCPSRDSRPRHHPSTTHLHPKPLHGFCPCLLSPVSSKWWLCCIHQFFPCNHVTVQRKQNWNTPEEKSLNICIQCVWDGAHTLGRSFCLSRHITESNIQKWNARILKYPDDFWIIYYPEWSTFFSFFFSFSTNDVHYHRRSEETSKSRFHDFFFFFLELLQILVMSSQHLWLSKSLIPPSLFFWFILWVKFSNVL